MISGDLPARKMFCMASKLKMSGAEYENSFLTISNDLVIEGASMSARPSRYGLGLSVALTGQTERQAGVWKTMPNIFLSGLDMSFCALAASSMMPSQLSGGRS